MAAREPIFNIPRAVLWASLLMIGIQIVRMLLPEQLALNFLLALAFIPARYSGLALEFPGGYPACVTSFFTYMVVHAGWVHLCVNLLWMLAFGSAVARRVGDFNFVTFSVAAGVAGALTHLAFHLGDPAPVVGASAAISGQMAATLRMVFAVKPARTEEAQERVDLASMPLPTLQQSVTDPRMLFFLALWVVINLLFGLGFVQLAGAEGGIAWEAHIGGFVFGLLAFGFFDRPQVRPEPPSLPA